MEHLIEVEGLYKHFPVKTFWGRKKGSVKAVDGVSFYIDKGKTVGLVGESGCGKSTLGKTIIRMNDVTAGRILFNGEDISKVKGRKLKEIHSKMQIIFQDPYSSLDPHMTVKDIIAEPLRVYRKLSEEEIVREVSDLLEQVGLRADDMKKYAYEFSGGQRQRIGIARAISVKPEFILCDEPISALDVSIQAQVVNLLKELQEKYKLTYLFVAHDLTMVHHIADVIAVMYLGKIVEIGSSDDVYFNPKHPYTQALMKAVPKIEKDKVLDLNRDILEGDLPSPLDTQKGCSFCGRCPYAEEICKVNVPELKDDGTGHRTACFMHKKMQKNEIKFA